MAVLASLGIQAPVVQAGMGGALGPHERVRAGPRAGGPNTTRLLITVRPIAVRIDGNTSGKVIRVMTRQRDAPAPGLGQEQHAEGEHQQAVERHVALAERLFHDVRDFWLD